MWKKRSVALAVLSAVSGCSTLVPLQMTKNETCNAPETTDASMGISEPLGASPTLLNNDLAKVPRVDALLSSLKTDREGINSGAAISAASISLTPMWCSLGLVEIDPSIRTLRSTIESTKGALK
jgi:hypothetical protein